MTTDRIRAVVPEPVKTILRPIRNRLISKEDTELAYWMSRLQMDRGQFSNSYYERLMLSMAGETSAEFLAGQIVADFGCGPRGSLVWARPASLRIGIDVLADRYADEFTTNILSHGMVYLKCTEHVIPLPSGFVDVMFTLNAIDHVDNFETMCSEIIRVIRPGGLFIGSFNLEEHPTPTEPQQLSELIINETLLRRMEVQSYRIMEKPEQMPSDAITLYAPFFDGGDLSYRPGAEGYLWVRARKPGF
jgi:SAM-dependent methyltransferase